MFKYVQMALSTENFYFYFLFFCDEILLVGAAVALFSGYK